jgi:hypothetical protein
MDETIKVPKLRDNIALNGFASKYIHLMSKRKYLPMGTSSVMSKTMTMLSASEEMIFVI